MAPRRLFKSTRMIEGYHYYAQAGHRTKTAAQEQAKRLRNNGSKARVLKVHSFSETNEAVWVVFVKGRKY